MPADELFISIDTETSGPIPGDYSLLSIGAVAVGRPGHEFYIELKPLPDAKSSNEAMQINGLDLDLLTREGCEAAEAMRRFAEWIRTEAGSKTPVFVGHNAPFDWMFVQWYFVHFTNEQPLGYNALDVKSLYMGASGVATWQETSKDYMPKELLGDTPHTHNALEDAREQAAIFEKVLGLARKHA